MIIKIHLSSMHVMVWFNYVKFNSQSWHVDKVEGTLIQDLDKKNDSNSKVNVVSVKIITYI